MKTIHYLVTQSAEYLSKMPMIPLIYKRAIMNSKTVFFTHIIGFIALISAYALLIPGITEPVLHITTMLDKGELTVLGKEAILTSGSIPNFLMPVTMEVLNQINVTGTVVIQDTAKSILGTAQGLWQDGNLLVAFLIVFFSLVVPVVKLALLGSSYLFKTSKLAQILRNSSGLLSKWSMADVFVMALIISFLAIKASSGESALLQTEIGLQSGFYYFLGYCLLSIFASQLLAVKSMQSVEQQASFQAS
ncbi:paraquat-inducible membrane protein PqiA family [Thiomicrorhabdus immobilis]|uniref:Paraquat-inducible membrane protein PqiA family n=1 Tax=Thiomicrorhabdus immobilis TaxID=2791037 RepID=A0ABM7MEX5_9GAMM|nr:paraquat-inducible protein A [Thiomicrorhabdus immobilis]BCN94006.1 paraquat-inducible membrane protein PqiA family [Thiomicrorhabdus immobilis]